MACTMPGFPDKYMPFMDEDAFGGAAATFMKFSYGPLVRYFRKRHIKNKYDIGAGVAAQPPDAHHRLRQALVRETNACRR